MLKVQVKAFARIKDVLGSEVELEIHEDMTVGDLLNELIKKYGDAFKRQIFNPETGKLQSYVRILLNGRDIDFLNGLETRLNNGDVLALFPPIAGG
ncbi:TPA: MoaD family protein [Candidatus Bathyarchaeota archaeon]|nr:MoaD family protein [Candidatus Bathyarchaeota archaeon]